MCSECFTTTCQYSVRLENLCMDKIIMNNSTTMKTVTGYVKFKKFVVTTISTTSCVNAHEVWRKLEMNLNSTTTEGWFLLVTESESES